MTVTLSAAVFLAVMVIFGVYGLVKVVQLVEVDEVVVVRYQVVLAIGFFVGVVAENDRNRRIDAHGWEVQGECGFRTDRDEETGFAVAKPVEKREQHSAPFGVSP